MALKQKLSRIWFYFRAGYGFYFVFIVSGLNALMIAYFVVILGTECEQGRSLLQSGDILCAIRYIFPHFGYFVLGMIGIGVPTMVTIGYFHYQKNQYGTHAHVNWRSNPYQKATLEIFLELIKEVKQTNPYNKERLQKLNDLEEKLKRLAEDSRLDEAQPEDDFRNF